MLPQKSTRSPLPSWPIHPSYKSSGSTSVGWNWNKSTFPTKQQRDYIQYSKYTLYIRCFFGGWLFFGSPHSKGFPHHFPYDSKRLCQVVCVSYPKIPISEEFTSAGVRRRELFFSSRCGRTSQPWLQNFTGKGKYLYCMYGKYIVGISDYTDIWYNYMWMVYIYIDIHISLHCKTSLIPTVKSLGLSTSEWWYI